MPAPDSDIISRAELLQQAIATLQLSIQQIQASGEVAPLGCCVLRYHFCAYADLIAIKKIDCDAVFRKHQYRKTSMRQGKIVGDCDKLVTWYKPKTCLKGLSKEEFDTLPQTITVREIYYYIVIPGFRTQRVSLITTKKIKQLILLWQLLGFTVRGGMLS
ncbi:hypothetical protein [uncultured Nostoc sp.]|uniref:hypothetical protein n=1 Tax=uncultured Nostoc sp. TaxID=340711 RepID=UPI0035CC903A